MVAPLAGLKVLDIAQGIAAPFCAKLFGSDYASLLAKAADVAAKGEQKAVTA